MGHFKKRVTHLYTTMDRPILSTVAIKENEEEDDDQRDTLPT